jgi:hypothetical protein
MYQPELRPDQIKSLYFFLKLHRRRPMTKLLREIVGLYLAANPVELGQGEKDTEGDTRRKR